MAKSHTLKFQRFPLAPAFYLLFLLCFCCQSLWAAQDAMVLTERAIIYSDLEMTSPIGYIARGKKIVVGDIPRNKAQLFPLIVSGKVAYIRVVDVTTEKESMDSQRLSAERFTKNAHTVPETKFVLSYFRFISQINQRAQNGTVQNNDRLIFQGLNMKAEVLVRKTYDVQLLVNYMFADQSNETYRVFETGIGAALRLINERRFIVRAEGQLLAVPFSTYSLGEEFRVKSFGYTVGGGINMTYLWSKHWGVEGYGGLYYTKLLSFDTPQPFKDPAPSFLGARFGVGLNYTF